MYHSYTIDTNNDYKEDFFVDSEESQNDRNKDTWTVS